MHLKDLGLGSAAIIALVSVGCSSNSSAPGSSTGGLSASKPSGLIGAVSDAVASVGTNLSSSALVSTGQVKAQFEASDCSAHGDPASLNQSQEGYPGTLTYCKLSVNDGSPDTVQGGFSLVKSVSCALENAGLVFDNTPRTVTLTISSACFSEAQMSDMGGDGTQLSATVTASSPASFNSNYERGIIVNVPDAEMEFKIGSKYANNKIEFITYENGGANRTGMTAGSLDQTTGEVRFEARMERIDCATNGSCGWNRHFRIYANMTMEGSEVGELEDISFAYSNTQAPPGQSGYGGVLITASGALSTGIKARLWQATDGSGGQPASQSDYTSAAKWVHVPNSKCYTSNSDAAGTCGAGIDKFSTNTHFALTGGHSSPEDLFTSISSQTFTSVDPDADTQ